MTDTLKRIKQQIALEMNCSPEDLDSSENIITTAIMHEKRRIFSDKPTFLQMVTFGKNAVISADERIHPWLKEWVKGKTGFWLFEQHNFYELECELRRYGQKMAPTHHMFAPRTRSGDPVSGFSSNDRNSASQPSFSANSEQFIPRTHIEYTTPNFPVKWLEQPDIAPFYGREEFPNAICGEFLPLRPDVLAVIALDGDNIMGMAGCSADTPEMWQIGIDVLPQYRGRGIAKTLVSLLKDETIRRGAIPYYGTSLSNIGSWRTAIDCGFVPAWTEVESRKIKDNEFAK